MPSPQTDLKVAQFLKTIIQGEKQLEAYRQVLIEQPNFDPHLTFSHIDKESFGQISPYSISSFLQYLLTFHSHTNDCLREHNINFAETDIVNLFSQFDKAKVGKISYSR